MLESMNHRLNSFLTLTYDPQNLPLLLNTADKSASALSTLEPKHLSDFLKRLRKAIEPLRIRYFAVGEYGDATERPHYHVALFGYGRCSNGYTQRSLASGRCCSFCDQIQSIWSLGTIFSGSLELHSAQYIAGYVTKKLTSKTDPKLKGRYPEFARMSLKPGIGYSMLHDVASTLLQYDLDAVLADIPAGLSHGKKTMPYGRYLASKLRELIGRDGKAPQAILDKIEAELLPVREAAFNNSSSYKEALINAGNQDYANLLARQELWKRKLSI